MLREWVDMEATDADLLPCAWCGSECEDAYCSEGCRLELLKFCASTLADIAEPRLAVKGAPVPSGATRQSA
jgi:hypothetical protein